MEDIMPVTKRINEKDIYARLRPVYDKIQEEVFFNQGVPFYLSGPGVRDAIYGGFDNNFVLTNFIPDNNYIPSHWWKYIGESLDRTLEKFLVEDDICYQLETRMGKFNFKIKNDYQPIWSFDNYLWGPTLSLNNLSTPPNISARRPKDAAEAKEQLIYGNQICQQYGWVIPQNVLEMFASVIELEAPLEKAQPVVGFRAYNIENGYLKGAHQATWETAKLSVNCPDFRLHIRESATTVGGISRNEKGDTIHSCGIYIYKDPTECVHYYGIGKRMGAIAAVIGWGDTWEGERGYRVEHARIEKLWVLTDQQLRPYDIYGGVIVNAKLNDFYKDIYTSGLEFEASRSLF